MGTLYRYMKSLGYNDIQQSINSGPGQTIHSGVLQIALNWMFSHGWEEIDPLEADGLENGCYIKYITKDISNSGFREVNYPDGSSAVLDYSTSGFQFRSGGWLISVNRDEEYILYRPHNISQPPVPVQLTNIHRLFYISRQNAEKNKRGGMVYFKVPERETNYPVYLTDHNGNNKVVYYAQDKSKVERFINSNKYQSALVNGWKFDIERIGTRRLKVEKN